MTYDEMIAALANDWIASYGTETDFALESAQSRDTDFLDFCDYNMDNDVALQYQIERDSMLEALYLQLMQDVQSKVYDDVIQNIQNSQNFSQY